MCPGGRGKEGREKKISSAPSARKMYDTFLCTFSNADVLTGRKAMCVQHCARQTSLYSVTCDVLTDNHDNA